MSLNELKIPDYREQSPAVAARFQRIRQRPVILNVRDLKKAFGTNGSTHVVFDHVSLEIHRREFICVVGPSGCGKSTLARIVAGLDEATRGEILLDGHAVTGPGPDRGMVFQGYTLFPWLTVKSNVMFGLRMHGKEKIVAESEARQWLDMVGLSKFENLYPHELSGGMKQRVAIARALANNPRILIMDEPFAALDAQTRAIQQDELVQLSMRMKRTVLFITHDIAEAILLGDRVGIMRAGPESAIKEIMDVRLPRPRLRSSVEFGTLYERINQSISDEVRSALRREDSLLS